MGKLLPLILLLAGTGAGVGAGFAFAPAGDEADEKAAAVDCVPPAEGAAPTPPPSEDMADGGREYAKMNNQFVIPVISDSRVASLVVASLSLEVPEGTSPEVFAREPKLRDAFLGVLMDHASVGGFDGNFTASTRLSALRTALLEATRPILGQQVSDVLITELARQDN
jgi:hypothetical protein